MARFKYRMASLLSVRTQVEEQKKIEFGKASLEYFNQLEILNSMESNKADSVNKFKSNVEKYIDPLENRRFNEYLILLNERINKQKAAVRKAEIFREQKREELVESTKEKKKLEKHKEKKYEEYILEEKKEEQAITDEVVSYRFRG